MCTSGNDQCADDHLLDVRDHLLVKRLDILGIEGKPPRLDFRHAFSLQRELDRLMQSHEYNGSAAPMQAGESRCGASGGWLKARPACNRKSCGRPREARG